MCTSSVGSIPVQSRGFLIFSSYFRCRNLKLKLGVGLCCFDFGQVSGPIVCC